MKYLPEFINHFEPFFFVMVMGTGISSDLLHSFPYPACWLKICSYIMFAIACIIFVILQIFAILHLFIYSSENGFQAYFNHYFRNLNHNVFWGTYPMGLVTLINYISMIAIKEAAGTVHAKRLMYLVYIMWWYDVLISLLSAWGISFIIWQDYNYTENKNKNKDCRSNSNQENLEITRSFLSRKTAHSQLKSILLLAVIPIVVVASSSGIFTMTDLFSIHFNRNIQLLTLFVTALLWLHAIIFVFILISIYFWNLYVNKIPAMSQVFTLFLVLGPLGQGSFGILLLTENVRKYVQRYYQTNTGTAISLEQQILTLSIPWSFKVMGLVLALGLLAMGYFFSFISFISIISYSQKREIDPETGKYKRIYHFHKGFWAMTFPMGTMSLGSTEIFVQYNEYVPTGAFRVIGTIYAVICILWTIFCLLGSAYIYWIPGMKSLLQSAYNNNKENSGNNDPSISDSTTMDKPSIELPYYEGSDNEDNDENDENDRDRNDSDIITNNCMYSPNMV
ncbi:Ssu1p NDAI_0E02670 [Naumovozyma dairenensis CBS 421]|uniref:Sulfite efflux pump SSU1 n=1 Tax=Naumovozyma dairenensis (strain ATCC 10597 / BCRC 20456 / CBS 421 / NBRC 0211 / NRRL Y-12639) TaxID=1071378 RepID=G0WBG4_NAUDC|nr:hypothetical protein NDAI_0E02670 [Naumovozyma dairenensis CBS 421]CCD25084.1 hypothetical protein NDAI_0E02670 [Naumovozyma dairenensis CBS 421]